MVPQRFLCVKRNVLAHRNDLTHTNKTNGSKVWTPNYENKQLKNPPKF